MWFTEVLKPTFNRKDFDYFETIYNLTKVNDNSRTPKRRLFSLKGEEN
jgi:hypothetical protein